MEKDMIQLKSSDDQIFEIEKSVIFEYSGLIKGMIEKDMVDSVIPLIPINSQTLIKIIEYCNHHYHHHHHSEKKKSLPLKLLPPPPSDDGFSGGEEKKSSLSREEEEEEEELKKFDSKFINVEQELIYDLIMGANFLDIKSLINLGCQKVADMINGKSAEEIREILNIENDFTPGEEEELRKQNSWSFE